MNDPFRQPPPWYQLLSNVIRGVCAVVAVAATAGGAASRDPPLGTVMFVVVVLAVFSLGEALWACHWHEAKARKKNHRTIPMSRSARTLGAVVCIFWAAALGQSTPMKDAYVYRYSSIVGFTLRTTAFLIDLGFWLVIRKESKHSEQEQGPDLTASTANRAGWSMFNRNALA